MHEVHAQNHGITQQEIRKTKQQEEKGTEEEAGKS